MNAEAHEIEMYSKANLSVRKEIMRLDHQIELHKRVSTASEFLNVS